MGSDALKNFGPCHVIAPVLGRRQALHQGEAAVAHMNEWSVCVGPFLPVKKRKSPGMLVGVRLRGASVAGASCKCGRIIGSPTERCLLSTRP